MHVLDVTTPHGDGSVNSHNVFVSQIYRMSVDKLAEAEIY